MAPLTELLKNPEWFPIGLSQDYRTIRFGRVPRDDLAHEAFLDQRMSGSVKAVQEHPVREIVAQAGEFPAELPVFVFHSAFCCSTLLARAFDAPGRCLSLKEPDVLMGLANALRTQNDQQRIRNYCALSLAFSRAASSPESPSWSNRQTRRTDSWRTYWIWVLQS